MLRLAKVRFSRRDSGQFFDPIVDVANACHRALTAAPTATSIPKISLLLRSMSRQSGKLGKLTLTAEVANVSAHGFWLDVAGKERFLPFEQFPWFRDATIGQLANVQLVSPRHVRWPDLDIDLSVDSLDRPEDFPLVSRSSGARPPARPRRRSD